MHSVTVWNTFCHRMHYVTERNLFCDRMYSVTECTSFCHRMHSVTEYNLFCHRMHSVTKCYTFYHRMHSANYSIFYILFFFQSHKRLPICGVFGKRMHRTRKQNRKCYTRLWAREAAIGVACAFSAIRCRRLIRKAPHNISKK